MNFRILVAEVAVEEMEPATQGQNLLLLITVEAP
jgi:hypothetical protein